MLYYDSIGLLTASERSAANYRRYSASDLKRLEQICLYRRVGLTLAEIMSVLQTLESTGIAILEGRLAELNREIGRLRQQQQVIIKILENNAVRSKIPVLDKDAWVALLHSLGLGEAELHQWHHEFAKQSPEAFQGFLESLGLPREEIDRIRVWAGASYVKQHPDQP